MITFFSIEYIPKQQHLKKKSSKFVAFDHNDFSYRDKYSQCPVHLMTTYYCVVNTVLYRRCVQD